MFRLIAEPRFTHPVAVMVPVDGGHAEQTFRATFRVVPAAEADGFEVNTASGLSDFLKLALVDLLDVFSAEDRPLPWNDALRDQMLELPYVRIALFKTYMAALTKARAGN